MRRKNGSLSQHLQFSTANSQQCEQRSRGKPPNRVDFRLMHRHDQLARLRPSQNGPPIDRLASDVAVAVTTVSQLARHGTGSSLAAHRKGALQAESLTVGGRRVAAEAKLLGNCSDYDGNTDSSAASGPITFSERPRSVSARRRRGVPNTLGAALKQTQRTALSAHQGRGRMSGRSLRARRRKERRPLWGEIHG